MSTMPLSFWLGHALVSVLGAALITGIAILLHRALRLSHAARSYWLGVWMLAVLPTPIAIAFQLLMPNTLTSALPTLGPLSDISAVLATPAQAPTGSADLLSLGTWVLLFYLAGLTIVLVRWSVALGRLRALRRATLPIDADDLPGAAARAECSRLTALRIQLVTTAAPVSPFALRWPRPTIVLPHALIIRLDDRQLQLVMRHEATHLLQHDPQWALLTRIVGQLLWFNPLLPLIARRVHLAAELCCDAAALGAEKNMRRAYAEAYLETLHMSMTRALPCPAIAFSPQDLGSHRMRIEHILHGDPRSRKRPLLSLALGSLALALGAAFVSVQAATDAAREPVVFSGPIIEGRVSSGFGVVRPDISRLAHKGIDLVAARGTSIHAPAAGTVLVATVNYEAQPNYGTIIILDHGDGWQSVYAHLDALDVAEGDKVAVGQRIGRVGSTGKATGPHVHVEVLRDGEHIDPTSVIRNPV